MCKEMNYICENKKKHTIIASRLIFFNTVTSTVTVSSLIKKSSFPLVIDNIQEKYLQISEICKEPSNYISKNTRKTLHCFGSHFLDIVKILSLVKKLKKFIS